MFALRAAILEQYTWVLSAGVDGQEGTAFWTYVHGVSTNLMSFSEASRVLSSDPACSDKSSDGVKGSDVLDAVRTRLGSLDPSPEVGASVWSSPLQSDLSSQKSKDHSDAMAGKTRRSERRKRRVRTRPDGFF
jgi:hypothetical protein